MTPGSGEKVLSGPAAVCSAAPPSPGRPDLLQDRDATCPPAGHFAWIGCEKLKGDFWPINKEQQNVKDYTARKINIALSPEGLGPEQKRRRDELPP